MAGSSRGCSGVRRRHTGNDMQVGSTKETTTMATPVRASLPDPFPPQPPVPDPDPEPGPLPVPDPVPERRS